jgi:hypothetical protein
LEFRKEAPLKSPKNKKGGFIMVDETALQNYLLKCELQYRAEHANGVERVGWLMEYTKTVKQTARFLRDIGFRVKETVDDVNCAGDRHSWVVTTSGVVVYADGSGLVGKAAR